MILDRNVHNHGLDYLRGIAILLVLISHGRSFFKCVNLQTFSFGGFYGVIVFFVLSGYLIGMILIRDFVLDYNPRWILKFYLFRWFRTFPLYFILLLVLYILGKNFNWYYLFFLQNIDDNQLNLWGVTWSLSIEEWFYLFMPLLFIFNFSFNKKNTYLTVVITIILVEVILRIIFKLNFNWSMTQIRKTIYLQMDLLGVGLLLAYINCFVDSVYWFLGSKFGFILGILLMVITFIVYVAYDSGRGYYENSFFTSTFYFSLASFSVFMLIPYIKTISFKQSYLANFLTFNAKISYSL